VRIKGSQREFKAVSKDISMQGALILLPEEHLAAGDDGPLDAAAQFRLLDRHLGENFDIQFCAARMVVEARLTRFTLTTDRDGFLGLGCHFLYPLSEKQACALGLREEQELTDPEWEVSVCLLDVRRDSDPARPLTALLLDANEAVSGPAFLGPVLQAGRRALVVRLDGVSPDQARERLSDSELRVCLTRGTKRLLEVPADFVAVRYVDGARPGTDVLLALSQRLPRAAWRHFSGR